MTQEQLPKIVILSATAGYGHFKAGKDLAVRLAALNLGVEVHHLNIFDYSGTSVRVLMERTWSVASVSPVLRTIYSSLHRSAISSERFSKFFRNLHVFAARKLEKEFADQEVLAVIALHPSAAAAASLWKRKREFKLYSVATDLIIHAMQCYQEIDHIFADQRAVIVSKAAINAKREARIVVSGLPISSQHYNFAEIDRDPTKRILVSFGAFGMRARHHIEMIIHLAGVFPTIQFHFVCGNNSKLLDEVGSRVADEGLVGRVVVHGFIENMAGLMQQSFLLIGKPGGITSGEALAQKKPIVFLDLLPGQEEYNQQVMVQSGLGFVADSVDEIAQIISEEQLHPTVETAIPLVTSSVHGIEFIASHIADDLAACVVRKCASAS